MRTIKLAQFFGGIYRGSCHGIAIDSRNVLPGQLFFALKGQTADGHNFLKNAAEKGAKAAVVSNDYDGQNFDLHLIKVPDVLAALHSLTEQLLKKSRPKIVAVTGSVGKTTTKNFITSLLKKNHHVGSSKGNHNSQLGLPLTVINDTQGDEEILVLEMGMSHPGNIKQLTKMAPPDVAVVTAVDLAHVINFNSVEEIANCKSEICSHPNTRLSILAYELNVFEKAKWGACPKVTFSVSSPFADFYAVCDHNKHKLIVRDNRGSMISLPAPNVPGKHNIHNLLAAITVARSFGVEWKQIAATIPQLCLPERRLELIDKGGVLFINDSYNAAVASMKAALELLNNSDRGGKKFAFLGSMRELGKFSEACHLEVGHYALNRADFMLCLGEETRPIYELWKSANRDTIWSKDRSFLVSELKNAMQPGDTVLLKGSNASELWKVLDEV